MKHLILVIPILFQQNFPCKNFSFPCFLSKKLIIFGRKFSLTRQKSCIFLFFVVVSRVKKWKMGNFVTTELTQKIQSARQKSLKGSIKFSEFTFLWKNFNPESWCIRNVNKFPWEIHIFVASWKGWPDEVHKRWKFPWIS